MSDPPTNIRALQADQILEVTWPDVACRSLSLSRAPQRMPVCDVPQRMDRRADARPESIRPDLKLVGMENIGTYAVQLAWNDGHSSGIFTWETLRAIGEPGPLRELRSRPAWPPLPGPAYRRHPDYQRCVSSRAKRSRSILSQERRRFELIVSDDRSDDDTLGVVRARPATVLASRSIPSVSAWRETGTVARPWLARRSSRSSPGRRDAARAPGGPCGGVAADVGIGLVASASVVIDERGGPVAATVVEQGGLGPIDRGPRPGIAPMADGNPLRCSAVTLRLEAFNEAGGFDAFSLCR